MKHARPCSTVLASRFALAFALGALGCGSSKEPTFYALQPMARLTSASAGARATTRLVEVRRPSVAGYLDRADIVTRVADFRLRLKDDERWAEPLSDMIGRVLAEDLSARVGDDVFVEDGAISAAPDVVVAVNVLRFDAGEDGRVRLRAEVVVELGRDGRDHAETRAKAFTLEKKPDGVDTAALVAAMSALLGDLAGGVAGLIDADRR